VHKVFNYFKSEAGAICISLRMCVHVSLSLSLSLSGSSAFVRAGHFNSVAQEHEGSSPHSQQPATGPCPKLVDSNPTDPAFTPKSTQFLFHALRDGQKHCISFVQYQIKDDKRLPTSGYAI
jgi:hypothetical protein